MKYQFRVLTTLDNITKPFVLNERFHSSHQKRRTCWERGYLRNLAVSYQKLYGSN
uniref:hypothetical protein n=1 Tax=Candidatus Enterovibrio altilux TaxID=1927128 RepID=UPI0016819C4B